MKTAEEYAKQYGAGRELLKDDISYGWFLLAMRCFAREAISEFAKDLLSEDVTFDQEVYVKALDKIK